MCDATHHKPFGSGLTVFNGVIRHIVLYLNIYVSLLCQWLYNSLCLMLSFWFPPGFRRKGLFAIVLHDAFHVGFRKGIPKLILHTIFDVKPYFNLMNKGLLIYQKLHLRCN